MEYSSGRRSSRRLDHGGDRQANAALHRMVFTRLRFDSRTQAYCERRTQEGKTRGEIIRCLKRYAAREVFNLVRTVSRPHHRGVRGERGHHGTGRGGGPQRRRGRQRTGTTPQPGPVTLVGSVRTVFGVAVLSRLLWPVR
ncbi:hypothetical protein [Streptomyces sp. DG1A-41]|uniref:hypothetical protein n=1 Tax=Streptomyces sp. DG1A-41 TaxID=3125779 RepID=UPI0030D24DC0